MGKNFSIGTDGVKGMGGIPNMNYQGSRDFKGIGDNMSIGTDGINVGVNEKMGHPLMKGSLGNENFGINANPLEVNVSNPLDVGSRKGHGLGNGLQSNLNIGMESPINPPSVHELKQNVVGMATDATSNMNINPNMSTNLTGNNPSINAQIPGVNSNLGNVSLGTNGINPNVNLNPSVNGLTNGNMNLNGANNMLSNANNLSFTPGKGNSVLSSNDECCCSVM